MSISLVDQHLFDEVKSLLVGILSNSYIMKQEILTELPDDIVKSFINTYGASGHGKDIPMYFAFPQTPPQTAFLLAQYKGATEDTDNAVIGNLQGGISNEGENLLHEKLPLQHKDNDYYVTTTKPIAGVESVVQATTYKIANQNESHFPYNPFLVDNLKFDIYYTPKGDGKRFIPLGINTKEGVTIDFISSNTNTIRCLSAIFTYMEVYLRKSLEENGNVYLPEIEMNGMDLIADISDPTNSIGGQQLYYRRLQITYHVTQTINQGANSSINNIMVDKEGGTQ